MSIGVDRRLHRVLVVGDGGEATELYSELAKDGFACTVVSEPSEVIEQAIEQAPELIVLEIGNESHTRELLPSMKQGKPAPIIALIRLEMLDSFDRDLDVDDFIVAPFDRAELALRLRRLLKKAHQADNEILICGDLTVDLAKCEVSIGGKRVELTFKEYELLKFLASNKERVFSRETLLNKVWGYDYFGGDRTVDVHIRRLRSKIEDSSHTFIETVRNIGYRFSENLCNTDLTSP